MSYEAKVYLIKDFFAGAFGGMCLMIVGHPLDTIKVRLQTIPKPAIKQLPIYNGTLDCAKKIFLKEGITKGFYGGMAAPLTAVAPNKAFCFFGFAIGTELQQKHSNDELKIFQIFIAGVFSGLLTTAIKAPSERIKCLLQVQATKPDLMVQYKGPIDCAKHLLREGGIKSIYKGTAVTLLRDLPANGVYFASYDFLKTILKPEGKTKSDLSAARTLLSGGIAGIFFWVIGIPPDVLKSRLQAAPEGTYPCGVRDVFKKMMKEEGIGALYKGATPVFIRAFPANAACFYGFEFATKLFNRLFPN